MSSYFDYQALVGRLNIEPAQLTDLERLVREQYASDEMMFELRMLRTLSAIAEGATNIEDALSSFRRQKMTGDAVA